jgi:ParB-like nuclease family protein
MKIEVKTLLPNPFRNVDRYSIRQDKVDALKASIEATSFWDNLVARPNGKGHELAYGHHRLEALKELKVKEIDIPIRDLTDETMLKMMANENMEEWGASAVVEQETIRATVQAFADGKIKLPKVAPKDMRGGGYRVAPNFGVSRETSKIDGNAYTAETLAKFLGEPWTVPKVKNTLTALALNEEGVNIDFTGLSPKQAETVAREVRYAQKKSGDEKTAAKIGGVLAEEFRSHSDGRSKSSWRSTSVHTARDRTEDMLDYIKFARGEAKARAKKDKADSSASTIRSRNFSKQTRCGARPSRRPRRQSASSHRRL